MRNFQAPQSEDYSNAVDSLREYALVLVRQNYRDFGPTLAAEALLERHGIEVSRETLRKWMVEAGLWLSRKLVFPDLVVGGQSDISGLRTSC